MRRFSLTSLRVQAVLWTLLPLTVIMLIVGSVGLYAFGEVVSRLVQDRDRALVESYADRMGQKLVNQAGVLEALAQKMGTVSCFDDEGAFDERGCFSGQNSFVIDVIQRCLLDGIVGPVSLIYADGRAALSISSVRTEITDAGQPVCEPAYHNTNIRESYAEDRFFEIPRDTGDTYFSDVLNDGVSDEPQIIVAVPIVDEVGRFVGVLTGSYLLRDEQLGRDIAQLGVGTTYLVDRAGRVIWHPDNALLGADLSQEAPVRDLLRLQDDAQAQLLQDTLDAPLVVGYARIPNTGWGLVMEEQWEDVIGPVRTFQWILLGTLALGVVLVVVIISSGTRRLTDTIAALVRQTQQLARGNYAGQVHGGSIDEMRALSDAFNEMAERVARYRLGLQHYVAAITQTQEEERKRIARELHDDTIQSLIALGRRLELLEQSLENPIDAAKQLYQLQQMLTRTVAEVRQFSRDLRPLLLEDLGLVSALRQMLREMERRDGVETTLSISGEVEVEEIDDELIVALYRIAQEALNNIRKHARATRVEMELYFEDEHVRLVVRDNGQGFPLAETTDLARRGAFGLMGIRERAKLFGGTFLVESEPGAGTSVMVRLPLTFSPEWVLPDLPDDVPVPA